MSSYYTAYYPLEAAGLTVTVLDGGATGTTVATATLGSSPAGNGLIKHTVVLDEGRYLGRVRGPWPGSPQRVSLMYAEYVLDEAASIAAAGGGGGETAKFIGRATADTSGDEFALVFTADGAVDWASVNGDGDIAVEAPVSVNMVYRYHGSLDFTDVVGFTTDYSPDTGVAIKASRFTGDGFASNCGGPYFFIATGTEGTVFPIDAVEEGITQTQRAAANAGELVIHGTVNANGYDTDHVRVTGGVLTAAVAVWITRNALPDLPDLP